jgi:hypothetical protein
MAHVPSTPTPLNAGKGRGKGYTRLPLTAVPPSGLPLVHKDAAAAADPMLTQLPNDAMDAPSTYSFSANAVAQAHAEATREAETQALADAEATALANLADARARSARATYVAQTLRVEAKAQAKAAQEASIESMHTLAKWG